MAVETTLVLVKPDGMRRLLAGEVIVRLERRGYELKGARLLKIPQSDRPVLQLPLLGRMVNAPTAAIIYQFCQVALHGAEQRVSHFDAPVFAWR